MNRLACITTSCLAFAGCALDNPDPTKSDDGITAPDDMAPPEDEAPPSQDDGLAASAIQHVFVIAMENHGASDIYGNTTHAPYIGISV